MGFKDNIEELCLPGQPDFVFSINAEDELIGFDKVKTGEVKEDVVGLIGAFKPEQRLDAPEARHLDG